MFSAQQRRRTTHKRSRSLWSRALTLFALLVVAVASTMQVCHGHGEPAPLHASHGLSLQQDSTAAPDPGRSSQPGQSSPEDHCPLCVAMHSALPASTHVAPEPLAQIERINSVAADAERLFRWRFELLSRPPPALS